MSQGSPDKDRVEIIEKTTPYEGYFKIDLYTVRHRKFDGGWTQPLNREIFERGHVAVVLLYDPDRDSVVLIEQFRIGALAADRDPWLIEAVAGIIEPGEDSRGVVTREAVEEAGCTITDLEEIGTFFPSPGGSSETLALFCGRVDSSAAGGIHGLDHEGEDIRVLVLPTDEALEQLEAGRILNLNAVVTLQWLALNRARLKSAWTSAPST